MSGSTLLAVLWLPGVLASLSQAEVLQDNARCIEFWPESRYRNYGYDHIVHLHSTCEATALCSVSTNVNPQAYRVELPPKVEVEVLTFRASPAREFVANVTCELPR